MVAIPALPAANQQPRFDAARKYEANRKQAQDRHRAIAERWKNRSFRRLCKKKRPSAEPTSVFGNSRKLTTGRKA
jgi:hypothetical protein